MKSQVHIDKIEEYIYKCLQKGELSNDNLVQIIERINVYLNLKTIQQFATDNEKSYNGAKKYQTIISLFGCKLIADNN